MAISPIIVPSEDRPKKDALDRIAQVVGIASNVLGTAVAIPEYLQKTRLRDAELRKLDAETDVTKRLGAPPDPDLLTRLKESGVPVESITTQGEALDWAKRSFETPAQIASRERQEAMMAAMMSKEERESAKLKIDQEEAARKRRQEARRLQEQEATPIVAPGQKKIDDRFAADWADFNALGGFSKAQKDLTAARWAMSKLINAQKEGKNYTGPDVGLLEGKAKALVAPEAVDMEETISQIIMAGLRQALGAQFTEKEGRMIINQTFNPMLDEAINARRLRWLTEQLAAQFEAKQSAGKYFEEHKTLDGWDGVLLGPEAFTPQQGPDKDVEKYAEKYNLSYEQAQRIIESRRINAGQ